VTCVITGAGSGIGRATAVEMSRRADYDTLVLIGRHSETLAETKICLENKKKIILKAFDLTDFGAIPILVQDIFMECENIQCLLNIAGYTEPQALLTTSLENMKTTFEVNVFAPFVLIRECVRFMRLNDRPSKILNVASTAGVTARPGWLSYASSKAALVSLSQTLSEELAEYRIKVYCVSPGRCATALRKKLAPDEDQTVIMQPDEVGRIICDLVSNDEYCLDGQNIIIRKK
jgi:3-oxoacyl-[acyl-carrier protein] reductase